jgi:prepilin-type processing-associated H-X9-DG protein
MQSRHRALTLTELLVVVPVTGLLVGGIMASVGGVRNLDKGAVCRKHQHELAVGWTMYAKQNDGTLVPGRMYDKPGGKTNRDNWYDVGNGMKYRPRWAATVGAQLGHYAFKSPSTSDDRQDYVSQLYQCPQVSDWVDERNYAYGYNHQFLGNARQTDGKFRNFPVKIKRITKPHGTVLFADAMGTAADFPASTRGDYSNSGRDPECLGNHGWSLDPPRLTDRCDRGTGERGSPRTAIDPRHGDEVNVVFVDGHAAAQKPRAIGYRIDKTGRFVNAKTRPDGAQDFAHNRAFSATGRDDNPPDLPGETG